MKAKAGDIEALLRKMDPRFSAVLVYGPNEGLVRERARRIAEQVVEDLNDPFNVANLSPQDLKEDPARLVDEAAAISMMGGRRLVRLDAAADSVADPLKAFLDDPRGDSLVLITGGDLAPRSGLRKAVETAKNAIAIPCYADDARSLDDLIHQALRQHGLDVEGDAAAYLMDRLGDDRAVIRGELDKLAIFKAGDTHRVVTLADAQACVGDSGALTLDEVAGAVSGGDLKRLDRALARAFAQGESPVGVLRAVSRRLMRLYEAAGHMGQGMSARDAMKRLRPPVFFKEADAFQAELGRWAQARLATALGLLVEAEVDCKSTGMPDEAVCARTCMRIARAAAPRR